MRSRAATTSDAAKGSAGSRRAASRTALGSRTVAPWSSTRSTSARGPFLHSKNESDEPLGFGIEPLQAIDPSLVEALALEIGAHLLEIGLPGLLAERGGADPPPGARHQKSAHFLLGSQPESLDLDRGDLEPRAGIDQEVKDQVLFVAEDLALDRDRGAAMALVLQILLEVDSGLLHQVLGKSSLAEEGHEL